MVLKRARETTFSNYISCIGQFIFQWKFVSLTFSFLNNLTFYLDLEEIRSISRMPGYIHHIQWCVADLEKSMKTMMEGFQVKVVASRYGQNQEVVLQSIDITFMISQRTASNQPESGNCYPWLGSGSSHYGVADETIRCCNCSWRVQNFGSIADHVVECFVNIPNLKTHVEDRINLMAGQGLNLRK